MIVVPNIQGKLFGVVGLGKSGRATVASLLASGAQVVAWDDGEAGRAAAAKEFPALILAPVENWDYAAMASLVMSPGIFLTHAAVQLAQQHQVEVIGDVELLFRAQPHARYITITGTNGKSTTTTLIAHILKACGKRVEVGGNLGTPALALAPLTGEGISKDCHSRVGGNPEIKKAWIPDEALLPNSHKNLDKANSGMTCEDRPIYVLELSSYQLDLVRTTKFNTAVLLNISPDHLDHHGSMEAYIAAKMHIFDRMGAGDVAVVGVDDTVSDAICRELEQRGAMQVVPISAAQCPAGIEAVKSLQGVHNHQNAAASYAACVANGCAPEQIMAAMQTYPGLAHRMEWLGDIGGVQFVNDSKATNADAAEKALKTYDEIYWIAGGVAKEGGIAPLAPYFPKIRHAYLIGEAAADFAQTLEGRVSYTHCGTLENAFHAAVRDAAYAAQQKPASAPAVLLSPACASFDQFVNFEKRGEAFVQHFEALKSEKTHAPTA